MSDKADTKINPKALRVLSVSTDRKAFEDGSAVQERLRSYGSIFQELHVIVFSLHGAHGVSEPQKIADNVWVYPTRSRTRWLFLWDAYRLAERQFLFRFGAHVNVVTTQDPFETGIAGVLIARKFNVPLHVQIHTDYLDDYFSRNSFLNKLRVRIAPFVLKKASCVRVVSERIKEKLAKQLSDMDGRITVLPIRTDVEAIRRQKPDFDLHKRYPQFKFFVFMASRLTEEKDIATALRAFRKVREYYSYAALVIAGDGPEKENLQQLVEEIGLRGAVLFVGWQDDLIPFYKSANVFLLSSRYEGYGRTLIEAAAAGVPIVTTDVGIAGTMFKHERHALICPVGNYECIAKQILRILKDRVLVHTLRLGAESLSIADSHEEYLQKYGESIAKCLEPRTLYL